MIWCTWPRACARWPGIAKARPFVEQLVTSGELVAAVIYGSVARGDFNVWRDIDLLLILRSLSPNLLEALRALIASPPTGVQLVTWTPEEFEKAYRSGNPIAREALVVGEVLHGGASLRSLVAGSCR